MMGTEHQQSGPYSTYDSHDPMGDEADRDEEPVLLDVEVALLAALASRDVGGEPTEAVDLSTLSPTEKRALLALLQQRIELSGQTASPEASSGGNITP